MKLDYSTSRSPSPSSPASIRRRSLVIELQRGHRAAEHLRRRLIRSLDSSPLDDPPLPDLDLAEMIFKSFDNSLSIVKNSDVLLHSRSSDDCKIEDSGCDAGSRAKDRRGCYKRRKRGQSWTTEGEAPCDDGHAWRKYGQKMIQNSQYPRNYYRCTHKTDQGCQAIKHVQRISEDPSLYKTTYNGNHTCKNLSKNPQIIIPSSSLDQSDSSILLSFERSTTNNNHPFFPPSNNNSSLPIKQEQLSTITTANINAVNEAMMMMMNPQFNYLSTSPDPTTFSNGLHTSGLPTTSGSDHGGDVISVGTYSCSASPHSLEIGDIFLANNDHLDLIEFECDF